jgi:uncharacterized membrane protein
MGDQQMKMKEVLAKLTNTKTVLAIVSALVIVVQTAGYSIDNDKVILIVNSLCTIGILLGVMNDRGMSTINWNK